MIKGLIKKYRYSAREKRKKIFLDSFSIGMDTTILDLGSEDGSSIYNVLSGSVYNPKNIFIADIDAASIDRGATKYGFTPVEISENGVLPFDDAYFDIVYCSSVIEHVSVPKADLYKFKSGSKFAKLSRHHQKMFANEIRRVGKSYFVQTPNRWFLFESHTWLPFVGWFPRRVQIATIDLFNKFWIKKTCPDFCLLDKQAFSTLFPDAEIKPEISLGMVKSWMAIKRD